MILSFLPRRHGGTARIVCCFPRDTAESLRDLLLALPRRHSDTARVVCFCGQHHSVNLSENHSVASVVNLLSHANRCVAVPPWLILNERSESSLW